VLKVNDELGTCYDDPEERADDSNAVLKLLMTISSTAPAHVRDQTLPLLLNFPTTASPRDAVSARAQHVLNALSTLSGPPPLFETLVALASLRPPPPPAVANRSPSRLQRTCTRSSWR
jgi:predicted lipoprotein